MSDLMPPQSTQPGDRPSTASGISRRLQSRRVQRLLVASAGAPAEARRLVVTLGTGLPAELVERAELAVSELVTNAVIHGSQPAAIVTLVVKASAGRLIVDVADSGRRLGPATDGTGGYGLDIVDQVADSVTVDTSGPWRVVAAFTPR